MKNFLMSSVIGLVIGFLPGMGGSLAQSRAYVAAQKTSKHPEKFGTGIMDGIVASETSNNASIGGAMIPLLALGIPGDGPTAMLLGAFTIHGLVAGPLLFTTSGNLVNLIFAAMFACSLIMIVVEFFGIRIFSKIIDVPGRSCTRSCWLSALWPLMPTTALCSMCGCCLCSAYWVS